MPGLRVGASACSPRSSLVAVAACSDTSNPPTRTASTRPQLLSDVAERGDLPDLRGSRGSRPRRSTPPSWRSASRRHRSESRGRPRGLARPRGCPWEQSEGFLFGPVETEGIDPGIDSWPVNMADLDAVLAERRSADQGVHRRARGDAEGLPHHRVSALRGGRRRRRRRELTARELEYLDAVTAEPGAARSAAAPRRPGTRRAATSAEPSRPRARPGTRSTPASRRRCRRSSTA